MKKLKLTALGLGAKEILTREQLKFVLGGSGSGSGSGTLGRNCFVTCYCTGTPTPTVTGGIYCAKGCTSVANNGLSCSDPVYLYSCPDVCADAGGMGSANPGS